MYLFIFFSMNYLLSKLVICFFPCSHVYVCEFIGTFICCCSMEFLSRSAGGDAPLVAFGGSDGVIRVLSMITWKVWKFIDLSLLTTIFSCIV